MKHNLLTNVLVFVAGAAVGSAATYMLLKDKFEQIAQEEIDSVKESFGKLYGSEDACAEEEVVDEDEEDYIEEESERCEEYREAVLSGSPLTQKPDLKEYAAKLASEGYTNYSDASKAEEVEEAMAEITPYIIKPDDFGELDDYDTSSLLYFTDGTLVDLMDKSIIENPEHIVGTDFQNHYGEYEEDTVYVRNDSLKCDYEILRDYDAYDGSEE